MLHIKLKGMMHTATWGLGSKGQNSTFSEHSHVAYQIKADDECSNMQGFRDISARDKLGP